MNSRAQAEIGHRLEQKLGQLGASLVIPPISDPDYIVSRLNLGMRSIQLDVGGFMPRERTIGPAEFLSLIHISEPTRPY